MNILALADLHGHTRHFPKIAQQLRRADLILLCGDITNFGTAADAERVLSELGRFNKNILAVPGNCDPLSVQQFLKTQGCDLHGDFRVVKGIGFAGLGGSLPCPGHTPMELAEQQYETLLDAIIGKIDSTLPLVLVSHQPPFKTINDQVWFRRHVGSRTIRRFIEAYQPLICFTGHIHEGRGMDQIGLTTVVNAGPFRQGHYSVARGLPSAAEVETCAV